MQKGVLCIQCTDSSSALTGDFLSAIDSPSGERVAITPIFTSLVDLYVFLKTSGWTQGAYDPAHPTGVYFLESTKS